MWWCIWNNVWVTLSHSALITHYLYAHCETSSASVSCTLVHVYVFQRYIFSWYWEIYTSRCLSPIAKNLDLSLYYSWYVFWILGDKIFLNLLESWILLRPSTSVTISYPSITICNYLDGDGLSVYIRNSPDVLALDETTSLCIDCK